MNLQKFFVTNTWWGKILGALFGYLIAGSVGAIFGVLIGNLFDRAFASHFSNPHITYYMEKRKAIQKIFFESTFSVMGHIAKADGRVTEEELLMAKNLMSRMHLKREQRTLAKIMFNQGKMPDFNLDEVLHKLKNACSDNRELLKLFIDIQYHSAHVDGLTTEKIACLNRILTGLGFAPLHQQHRFQEDFNFDPFEFERQQRQQRTYQKSSSSHTNNPYQAPKTTLDHAFGLLELNNNANKQEVKRAYRRLMSRHHPDKLIAQGLPQEMIKIANERTQKIIKAYEMICRSKGW